MNRNVYLVSAVLIALAAALIVAKLVFAGQAVRPAADRDLWRVTMIAHVTGKGERAKVRLTLPFKNTERQTIYNEHFESDEMVFYMRERTETKNRIGFWRSELLDGSKTIQYTYSAQVKALTYRFPLAELELPEKPLQFYPAELHTWLDPSKYIQSEAPRIQKYLRKIINWEKDTVVATRKIFDWVRGEVKYKSERDSKDAKETLDKLVADCGGQARLFVALCRAAGIPSRIVGGIILEPGVKKITHVWVENYIGGQWIPFDVVNNHFAAAPSNYLELYRGDYYLFKHVGLARFDYFFITGRERIPPVDHRWSLYVLPIPFQTYITVLLLIPVGALVVAVFRNIVGVPTFGTFAPILIALAFREITVWVGLVCLAIILFSGWLFRTILDQFKILVIPRLSFIVTLVVVLVLLMMIVGYHIGQQRIVYISFFPMVILTWTIERFSVIQIEDGTRAALITMLGTTLVAAVAYLVMGRVALRMYLFTFPELLLVVMALLLIVGRYTGIRATELWRFRDLIRLPKRAPQS